MFTFSMVIQVVEFSNGGYKIRKIFAYESAYVKEIHFSNNIKVAYLCTMFYAVFFIP